MPNQYTAPPLAERFWSKVNRQGAEDCWTWTGGLYKDGYGCFHPQRGRSVRAHRYSFELTFGPILDGLYVLHSCPGGDNPKCVNPAHLRPGTQVQNMQDMRERGRAPEGERNGSHTHPERRPHGEGHANSKLTNGQVIEIRELYAQGGYTQRALSIKFGIAQSAINNVITGKRWKHVA